MLSYMLPVSEKPPLPPTGLAAGAAPRLQLALGEAAPPPPAPSPSPRPPRPGPGAPVPVAPCAASSATAAAAVSTAAAAAGSLPTDSSVSSLSSSDVGTTPSSQSTATPTDARPRAKLQANGKHPTLKRVSFGSSKGSMVETLVFESPLREEPEAASPSVEAALLAGPGADPEALAESKRVRVSFFECQRPVQLPPSEADVPTPLTAAIVTAMAVSSPEPMAGVYQRQTSTDSGWDNPFRPDGNLSREADEIVELIKGGKPITPTSGTAPASATVEDAVTAVVDGVVSAAAGSPASASPQHTEAPGSPSIKAHTATQQNSAKVGANGNAAAVSVGANDTAVNAAKVTTTPGNVEVQRATVDTSQAVEHVVLKKKQKCKCCVIQ